MHHYFTETNTSVVFPWFILAYESIKYNSERLHLGIKCLPFATNFDPAWSLHEQALACRKLWQFGKYVYTETLREDLLITLLLQKWQTFSTVKNLVKLKLIHIIAPPDWYAMNVVAVSPLPKTLIQKKVQHCSLPFFCASYLVKFMKCSYHQNCRRWKCYDSGSNPK